MTPLSSVPNTARRQEQEIEPLLTRAGSASDSPTLPPRSPRSPCGPSVLSAALTHPQNSVQGSVNSVEQLRALGYEVEEGPAVGSWKPTARLMRLIVPSQAEQNRSWTYLTISRDDLRGLSPKIEALVLSEEGSAAPLARQSGGRDVVLSHGAATANRLTIVLKNLCYERLDPSLDDAVEVMALVGFLTDYALDPCRQCANLVETCANLVQSSLTAENAGVMLLRGSRWNVQAIVDQVAAYAVAWLQGGRNSVEELAEFFEPDFAADSLLTDEQLLRTVEAGLIDANSAKDALKGRLMAMNCSGVPTEASLAPYQFMMQT